MPGSYDEALLAAGRDRATGRRSVRLQEAAGETILRLRPRHTGVHVDVPGEAPIEHQRDDVERTGALRGASRRYSRIGTGGKAVLPFVIIRTGDVEGRCDRVFGADPRRLQDPGRW